MTNKITFNNVPLVSPGLAPPRQWVLYISEETNQPRRIRSKCGGKYVWMVAY